MQNGIAGVLRLANINRAILKRFSTTQILMLSLFHCPTVYSSTACKHVLLEKLSISNSTEANVFFNLLELSQANALVLLEAFYSHIYSAVELFRFFISPADIVYVYKDGMIPSAETS